MPSQPAFDSWHVEQPQVMPAWIMRPVGGGVAKPVPGGRRRALAATRPPGTLARWQLSHVVDDGMCAAGPAGAVAGMATMLAMPAKVPAVTVGPVSYTHL